MLPYERQLEEKESQVRDALERIGRFEEPPVEPIVAAVRAVALPQQGRVLVRQGGEGELVLGFHRPGRWDAIDDVTEDVLASERVDELREAVKAWCRDEGLSAWDRRDQTGLLRNLVVREGRRTGQLQARIVTSPGDFRADAAGRRDARRLVALDARRGRGGDHPRRRDRDREGRGRRSRRSSRGLRLRISPDAFFQTNTEMAERLYGSAAEPAGLSGRERCSTSSAASARSPSSSRWMRGEVWGVELVEEAVADAIENARLNGIDNAHFFAGDVRTAMRPLLEEAGAADVVVVDPPRAGLSQKVVRRVLEAEARADRLRVVQPHHARAERAPDGRRGLRAEDGAPVDMFPQTPHIECVALLER